MPKWCIAGDTQTLKQNEIEEIQHYVENNFGTEATKHLKQRSRRDGKKRTEKCSFREDLIQTLRNIKELESGKLTQKDTEITGLETLLNSKNEEIASLKRSLDDHQNKAIKDKEDLKARISELDGERKEANEKNTELKAKHSEIRKEKDKHKKEKEKLRSDLSKENLRCQELLVEKEKFAEERNSFVVQIEKTSTRCKELEKELSVEKVNFARDRNGFLVQIKTASTSLESSLSVNKTLNDKIKWQNDQVKQRDATIIRKDVTIKELTDTNKEQNGKIQDLTTRLSKEISVRVADDESMENVSDANRPLALRDRYVELCSDEWLEAKDDLDDNLEDCDIEDQMLEMLKADVLCKVFMVSLDEAMKTVKTILASIAAPTANIKDESKEGSQEKLNKELQQKIMDFWRAHSNSVDNSFKENVKKQIEAADYSAYMPHVNEVLEVFSKSEAVDTFLGEACVLAWRMAAQQPPLRFETPGIGDPMDEDQHKPFYSCDPSIPETKVRYYINPLMFHGSKLVAQGLVFLSPEVPSIPVSVNKEPSDDEFHDAEDASKEKSGAEDDTDSASAGALTKGEYGTASPNKVVGDINTNDTCLGDILADQSIDETLNTEDTGGELAEEPLDSQPRGETGAEALIAPPEKVSAEATNSTSLKDLQGVTVGSEPTEEELPDLEDVQGDPTIDIDITNNTRLGDDQNGLPKEENANVHDDPGIRDTLNMEATGVGGLGEEPSYAPPNEARPTEEAISASLNDIQDDIEEAETTNAAQPTIKDMPNDASLPGRTTRVEQDNLSNIHPANNLTDVGAHSSEGEETSVDQQWPTPPPEVLSIEENCSNEADEPPGSTQEEPTAMNSHDGNHIIPEESFGDAPQSAAANKE